MTFDKVPAQLRESANWILWRMLSGDRKTPWQATTDRPAKANTPATWTTFEAAQAAFRRGYHAGLGYVFSPDDAFCGIDLDNCRDNDTGTAEWAKEIIAKFDTYTEVSPSGNGFKIYCTGQSPFGSGKKIWIDKDKKQAIEVYDQGRFFAITGQRVGGVSVDVEQRQGALDWLKTKFDPQTESISGASKEWTSPTAIVDRARKYVAKMPAAVSGSGGHNQCFAVACALVLGFELNSDDAMSVLAEYSDRCQPPWSDKELRHKISSAMQQSGPRGYLTRVRPENFNKIDVPFYEPREAKAKPTRESVTLTSAMAEVISTLDAGPIELVSLGIPGIDHALDGGVDWGELVVIAARPSQGKSAIGLQIMHHLSERDVRTLIVSEEMSATSLARRALLFASPVPKESWHSRIGELSKDVDLYSRRRQECFIAESCGSLDMVTRVIREHVEKHDVRLVILDYLQLINLESKSETEKVSAVSQELRRLTTELNVLFIALVQMNRELERRESYIPRLTDIRQSGQIEQDADVILFPIWPHRFDSSQPANEYKIFVAKNRNGPVGEVNLHFVKNQMRFESVSR